MKFRPRRIVRAGTVCAATMVIALSAVLVACRQEPYALVFEGPSTCEGCPEATGRMLEGAGLPVRYVADTGQIPSLLDDAVVFAIGGTEDDLTPLADAFTADVRDAVLDYVRSGGRYLGICGGAWFGSLGFEDVSGDFRGLGILPVTTDSELTTDEAELVDVDWQGEMLRMFAQSPPQFVLPADASAAREMSVLATYGTGDIAAVEADVGSGKALLVGPHPEATTEWLEADGLPTRGWEPADALATGLVESLLAKDG